MRHILQLPDGASVIEKKILNFAYANIYGLLHDPLDKFIVAFMFDMGNSVDVTAVASGVSRKNIWERKKRIQELLSKLKVSKKLFE